MWTRRHGRQAAVSLYETGVEVELLADMSGYHPKLKPGARGTTTPPAGMWSHVSDKYCSVKFPDLVAEVAWKHLRVVDERVLKLQAEARSEEERGIRDGFKSAVKKVGLRGGFKSLRVEYFHAQAGETRVILTTERERAKELEAILAERGHAVATEQA